MRFFGGLWERDGARHWIVASIVYVTLLGILLANLIPSRSELRVGASGDPGYQCAENHCQ